MRGTHLSALCVMAMLAITSTIGWTQSGAGAYPNKPVTIVLPFPPGGSTDIEARLYSAKLIEGLQQAVIIDYKPGAGASIGTIYVAKAAPDGYTILSVTPGFTVYPAFFPLDKLPFDPIRDFAPISLINKTSGVLLVHPSLGIKTFPEYLAYARANPDKINFGTSGGGGIFHIVGAWLHSATNTKVTFVHYKGVGPMHADFMAGRVHAAPGLPFVVAPFVKAGKFIPIATMSAERSRIMPDLKSIAEQDVAGYDYVNRTGFVAPARTPEAIVNRLSAEFAKVAKAPEIVQKMEGDGAEMVGSTPEQFRQSLVTDAARWRRIVQENGIKLEE